MYVCMYVCLYVCMYTYIHTYAQGDVLVELAGLSSPPLGLAVCPASEAAVQAAGGQEILATTMGGEALLLWLSRPADGGEEGWALEVRQKLPGHTKHCTSGRFAPLREGASASAHFVTVSRDRQARLYARTSDKPGSEFKLAGTVQLQGEVTSCCWASAETFVLAARDDHNLRYYDVDAEGGEPRERLKTNLNALGDNVVSFCVLALAMSPDGNFIAACTDKSRVILLRAFTGRRARSRRAPSAQKHAVWRGGGRAESPHQQILKATCFASSSREQVARALPVSLKLVDESENGLIELFTTRFEI